MGLRSYTWLAVSVWTWLHRLGGPGLILLGLADNSLIPLPGSMDVFTIILSGNHRAWWPYYAFMATVGAVVGGYLTYRLGRQGEKETLEKRLSPKKVDQLYRTFERRGFWAVTIPAMLPPPVPIVPFLLAAGAMHYPKKKFLVSLALGRAVRFTVLAFVSAHYGPRIFQFLARYYEPALYLLVVLALAAAIVGLLMYLHYRSKKRGRLSQQSANTLSSTRKAA